MRNYNTGRGQRRVVIQPEEDVVVKDSSDGPGFKVTVSGDYAIRSTPSANTSLLGNYFFYLTIVFGLITT